MLIIGCSFRAFLGTENDDIQRKFIDSLKRQTIKPHLVVSQFGELNVEDELQGLSYELIQHKPPWSFSQVLINAVTMYPDSNVLISTVDLVFEPNFCQIIDGALQEFQYATCWPYRYNDRDLKNSYELVKNSYGLDFVAISHRISAKMVSQCELYPNISWGLFEHQLVNYSYFASNRKRGINLYKTSPAFRFDTPHITLNEPTHLLRKSWRENRDRWLPWLNLNPTRKIWLQFPWIILKFKKTPIKYQLWLVFFLSQTFLKRIFKNKQL